MRCDHSVRDNMLENGASLCSGRKNNTVHSLKMGLFHVQTEAFVVIGAIVVK